MTERQLIAYAILLLLLLAGALLLWRRRRRGRRAPQPHMRIDLLGEAEDGAAPRP
jgi:LPXTG-motif cell wall-anchored protein